MPTVQQAGPEHAEIIAAFNQRMAEETEDKYLPTDIINAGVERMLNDASLGRYLVAKNDSDVVVGCLGVTYEWSDWRNGLFWWIQSVYVEPSSRASGVFTAMYRHVKELASEDRSVCGIRLYVEKDNDRAGRTYRRLGMIETDYRLMEELFP